MLSLVLQVNEFCKIISEFSLEYRTAREKVLEQKKKRENIRERNRTRGKLITEVRDSTRNLFFQNFVVPSFLLLPSLYLTATVPFVPPSLIWLFLSFSIVPFPSYRTSMYSFPFPSFPFPDYSLLSFLVLSYFLFSSRLFFTPTFLPSIYPSLSSFAFFLITFSSSSPVIPYYRSFSKWRKSRGSPTQSLIFQRQRFTRWRKRTTQERNSAQHT